MPLDLATNYFSVLELPQQFNLDLAQLEGNFKRLQRYVHPDLFATRGAQEREASAAASSTLNVAYKVLRDAPSRAQYLLKVQGIDAIGEGAGSGGVSPDLLVQVMEAREVIADPRADRATVAALKRRTDAAVTACVRDVSDAFARGDLQTAKAVTVALQYYGRVAHEAEEWLDAYSAVLREQGRVAAAAVADVAAEPPGCPDCMKDIDDSTHCGHKARPAV